MQTFNKFDFPVFHDILYAFQDSCGKYESLPYLNSFISDAVLKPNKKEYKAISSNLVEVLSNSIYKTHFPFVISRKTNNIIDFFIPMDVFYGLYCLQKEERPKEKILEGIRKEAKDNNISFLQFSPNLSNNTRPRLRFFLTDSNLNLSMFKIDPNVTYCKLHIKKLHIS